MGILTYLTSPTATYGLIKGQSQQTSFWIGVLSLTAFLVARYINSPYRHLPPGPKGLPLLGNLLQLTKPYLWLTFTEWRQVYGDIVSLDIAGQPMVILNSQKAAADLLDRRASIYSDRPRNIVASDILTGGLFIVFTGYSEIWRRLRRAAHENLYKGAVKEYYQTHITEAIILTSQVMADPGNWSKHFHRTSASTIMSVLYDRKPILDKDDAAVVEINNCVSRLTKAALPGAFLVEFFPWMLHIPKRFAKWKRDAYAWYESDSLMFEGLFNSVKERMGAGEVRPSIVSHLIEQKDSNNLTLRENAWLAGTMFSAGAETSTVVLSWWLLAMTIYPEIQKKGQEEIDAVVGRSRLPTFADLDHLPYVASMVKEALRWRAVDPMGLPHRSVEDDWYNGYFIPKGTIIVPNVWCLNRDPTIYGDDAHHFNPARHLDENGNIGPGPTDTKEEGHATYGFGRRICVGRHLANNSLFMNMAMMLWAMNIERAKDADGNLVPMDIDGCEDHGLVVAPVPFKPKMTPRHPDVVEIIDREMELLAL